MSDFYRILAEQDLENYCDTFYGTIRQPLARFIVTEAIISAAEVLDIFDTAAEQRGGKQPEESPAQVDAYQDKIEPKLQGLKQRASEAAITREVQAGGDRAQAAFDKIETEVNSQLQNLKGKSRGTEGASEIVQAAEQLAGLSKSIPESAAFIIGAISAANSMIAAGTTGQEILLLLTSVVDIINAPVGEAKESKGTQLDEGPFSNAAKQMGADIKRTFKGSKDAVSAEDLTRLWKEKYNSSTDTDDINALLLDAGFSRIQIKLIFRKADVSTQSDSDMDVSGLARKAKELGLAEPLLKWINRNERKISANLKEGTVVEQKLSDKQIKAIFQGIVKTPKETDEPEPQPEETGNLNPEESIQIWANKINESTNRAEKIMLANKAIDVLSLVYGTSRWAIAGRIVLEAIDHKDFIVESLNDGRVFDEDLFVMCGHLIESCDLSWEDFLTRPVKIAGYFKMVPIVLRRLGLSESNLGRKRK